MNNEHIKRHRNRKEDDASVLKKEALKAIKRKEILTRYSFIALIIISLIMASAVIFAYFIDK